MYSLESKKYSKFCAIQKFVITIWSIFLWPISHSSFADVLIWHLYQWDAHLLLCWLSKNHPQGWNRRWRDYLKLNLKKSTTKRKAGWVRESRMRDWIGSRLKTPGAAFLQNYLVSDRIGITLWSIFVPFWFLLVRKMDKNETKAYEKAVLWVMK